MHSSMKTSNEILKSDLADYRNTVDPNIAIFGIDPYIAICGTETVEFSLLKKKLALLKWLCRWV